MAGTRPKLAGSRQQINWKLVDIYKVQRLHPGSRKTGTGKTPHPGPLPGERGLLLIKIMQTQGNIENEHELLHWQSRVERVKEYVLANLATDLHIGIVAEKLGINKNTLRHLFKHQEGESYHDYVERMRMDKALQLLNKGKWVKEVMTATGYHNRGTFNNAFKKRYQYPAIYFKK